MASWQIARVLVVYLRPTVMNGGEKKVRKFN